MPFYDDTCAKERGSSSFHYPCTIDKLHFAKAFCDLGVSINMLPLSNYKKIGLRSSKTNSGAFTDG